MKPVLVRLLFVMLATVCVVAVFPGTASAIWQIALDEHFEEDQENPQLKWPWYTDLRAGEVPKRWYWNALKPYNRGVNGQPERHVWGLQNYIYCAKVVRDDKQALWCAYTNNTNTQSPHWPKEDDYRANQKAWVWWGPFNMAQMTNSICSFWIYVDLKQYSYDSLSAIVVTEDQIMLDFDDPTAWRQQVAFGCVGWEDEAHTKPIKSIWSNKVGDGINWTRFQFTLDSLLVNDRWTSYVGKQEDLFLAFVWQTDGYDIQGKGAFVDDVMVVVDDGLFDLIPTAQYFGYHVTRDSLRWSRNSPRMNDKVRFRCDWSVDGAGPTPPFTIKCYLDNALYFTEVVESALPDSAYRTICDKDWVATPGNHNLRWEIDAENDVLETVEVNNKSSQDFDVIWNPAPVYHLITPDEHPDTVDVFAEVDSPAVPISYTVSDSNDFDVSFELTFFLAIDTVGIAEIPERIWDDTQYTLIGMQSMVPSGPGKWNWNVSEAWGWGILTDREVYYVVSLAQDSDPLNLSISVAPSRIRVIGPDAVRNDSPLSVTEQALTGAFPNPFNNRLNIEYTLAGGADVKIGLFDVTGREVAALVNRFVSPGKHVAQWTPTGISGGVYMVRMQAGQNTYMKKVVYLP